MEKGIRMKGCLALLYVVETKRLKESVRRNADRFPEDFMFVLSAEEWASLRTQIASLKKTRGKHPKYPARTEMRDKRQV